MNLSKFEQTRYLLDRHLNDVRTRVQHQGKVVATARASLKSALVEHEKSERQQAAIEEEIEAIGRLSE